MKNLLTTLLAFTSLCLAQGPTFPMHSIPYNGSYITSYMVVDFIWYGSFSSGTKNLVEGFVGNINSDPSMRNSITSYFDQYGNRAGLSISYGTHYLDTGYSQGTSNPDVQNIVLNAMNNGLSNSAGHLYFVIMDPSVTVTGEPCAYHRFNTTYSFMYGMTYGDGCASLEGQPSDGAGGYYTPNGDWYGDAYINMVWHEAAEAATNPLGVYSGGGWANSSLFENGDACNFSFYDDGISTLGSGAHYNRTINGTHYWIQTLLGNNNSGPNQCTNNYSYGAPSSLNFSIRPKNDHSLCIDTYGSTTSGAQVYFGSCASANTQKWNFVTTGFGYKIVSVDNGLVLDIASSSTSNSAAVVQSSYTGADSQIWQVGQPDQGSSYLKYYDFVNYGSYRSLYPTGFYSGSDLYQYQWSGSDNGRWELVIEP